MFFATEQYVQVEGCIIIVLHTLTANVIALPKHLSIINIEITAVKIIL